nr:MAG TPA: hypothetical protein [Bacteriophage sp.]
MPKFYIIMKGQGNILKEVKLWQLIIHTICHNNSNLNMRRPLMYRSRGCHMWNSPRLELKVVQFLLLKK